MSFSRLNLRGSRGRIGIFAGLGAAVLAILFAIPLVAGGFVITVLTLTFAYAIFAASWDVIFGYTGQISLGPVFPYGISAFTVAYLDIHTSLPLVLIFLAGPVVATGAGLAIAGPSLRLSGNYLAVVTFAMGIIANEMALILTGEEGLTAGVRHFFNGAPLPNYYFGLILMVVCCGFMLWVVNSRIGTKFKSIREDRVVAEALGINTTSYKMLAFAINNFFSGVAGAFVVTYLAHVDYNFFQISLSFQIIAMTIVGGAGTIIGAMLGVFLLYIPASLLIGTGLYALIAYAIIIILVIILAREGLLPFILNLARRREKRRLKKSIALRNDQRAQSAGIPLPTSREPDER